VKINAIVTFGLSLTAFRLFLEYCFIWIISPAFGRVGLGFEFDLVKYLQSWGFFALLWLMVPKVFTKPSDFLLCFALVSVVLPLLSLWGLANQPSWIVYCVLASFTLTNIMRHGRRLHLPVFKQGQTLFLWIIWGGCLLVSVWFVVSGGTRYFSLSLRNVYEFRELSSEAINGGLMTYINNWTTKVLGPTLFAYGLLKKKPTIIVFGIALHVFWFGVTAHKAVLFSPILVAGIWFWGTQFRSLAFLPLGLLLIGLLTVLFQIVTGDRFFVSLFVRRIFFVTANNLVDYYEFFSAHPKVYWSNSSVGLGIAKNPYDQPLAMVVAQSRGFGNWVNNSYLSMGYMHAGYIGLIIYSVIVGFLFRLIDSLVSRQIPDWYVLCVGIIPLRAMITSSDLFTALLTHGVIVAILIIVLFRKNEEASPYGDFGDFTTTAISSK